MVLVTVLSRHSEELFVTSVTERRAYGRLVFYVCSYHIRPDARYLNDNARKICFSAKDPRSQSCPQNFCVMKI
jgi:hypothetical protein